MSEGETKEEKALRRKAKKRENWIRLVKYRTTKALQRIRYLRKLANCNSYEYTDQEVDYMLEQLRDEVNAVENEFNKQPEPPPEFDFTGMDNGDAGNETADLNQDPVAEPAEETDAAS